MSFQLVFKEFEVVSLILSCCIRLPESLFVKLVFTPFYSRFSRRRRPTAGLGFRLGFTLAHLYLFSPSELLSTVIFTSLHPAHHRSYQAVSAVPLEGTITCNSVF